MLMTIKRLLPSLLFAALPGFCQTNEKPLPNSALKDPGYPAFTLKTLPNSFQIYTCGMSGEALSPGRLTRMPS